MGIRCQCISMAFFFTASNCGPRFNTIVWIPLLWDSTRLRDALKNLAKSCFAFGYNCIIICLPFLLDSKPPSGPCKWLSVLISFAWYAKRYEHFEFCVSNLKCIANLIWLRKTIVCLCKRCIRFLTAHHIDWGKYDPYFHHDFITKFTVFSSHVCFNLNNTNIHHMHLCNVFHGRNSWLVASDVLTDFTSLTTNQLLGQWCNVFPTSTLRDSDQLWRERKLHNHQR